METRKKLLFALACFSLLFLLSFFTHTPSFISRSKLIQANPRTLQSKIPWFISVQLGKQDYIAMAAVALVTARKYPILEPHVMLTNSTFFPTHPFVLWLVQQNITFHVYHPAMTEDVLALRKNNKVDDNWVAMALGGVFGRFDAPRVYRQWGGKEEMVLYTDVDVMWKKNPSAYLTLSVDEPAVLAIGPEGHKGTKSNSGALWIHADRWLASSQQFYKFCRSRFWQGPSWDQGLLLDYFGSDRSILLPDKFNYKVYWGSPLQQNAEDHPVMIHFHGPKPKRCLDGCGEIACGPPYLYFLDQIKAHPGLCLETLVEFGKIYNGFQCPGDGEFVRYEEFQQNKFPNGAIRPC